MRTKTEIRKELTSISTEIAQLQKALAALQKELKTAPMDFMSMPDGLYWCCYQDSPRFILKLGEDLTAYGPGSNLAAETPGFIVNQIRDGGYAKLKLLKVIELSAPQPDLSDIDWDLIKAGPRMAGNFTSPGREKYIGELEKIAERVRPKEAE